MAATTTDAEVKRITVKWVKSAIGYNVRQKRTLKALGLTKLGQEVQHDDTPQIRGMLDAVKHLVEVK
ncbi:MAG: 50S ribosomal protein L30 [Candidatus Roseilinea sp.]|nr:MAG: 50S ribosomal protein L30 [Candidatus Roseilinea sp.]